MTHQTLNPGQIIAVPYRLPAGRPVSVRVLATSPVQVFLLDESAKQSFERGERDVPSWVRPRPTSNYSRQVMLPRQSIWWLVLENVSPREVTAVSWEIAGGMQMPPPSLEYPPYPVATGSYGPYPATSSFGYEPNDEDEMT